MISAGLTDNTISEQTAIPRSTVRDWRKGNLPASYRVPHVHDPNALPSEEYAYLLGTYLGDGCLTACPRGVWKLRIFCDAQYTEIIEAIVHSMSAVRGDGKASVYARPGRCVEVATYWKHWVCLFPQHGPGPKWQREIKLAEWQQEIVEREREAFVRGLLDSDGCRITATYREKARVRRYGRYIFSNRSEDIHRLFTESLDALGVHWTRASFKDVAVARQADVRKLDRFIGTKE